MVVVSTSADGVVSSLTLALFALMEFLATTDSKESSQLALMRSAYIETSHASISLC